MAIVVRLQHHHIHLILNLQNENKNKMLNRLSFLSENDDPQKYKNDRESKVIRSGNRQSGITYWVGIRSKLGANAYRPFAKD